MDCLQVFLTIILYKHRILLGGSNQGELDGQGMWHAWEGGEKRVGKPEGKRPLERPRHRWEDVIKMDLREFGSGDYGVDSSGSG
jgi:hypothetical protein